MQSGNQGERLGPKYDDQSSCVFVCWSACDKEQVLRHGKPFALCTYMGMPGNWSGGGREDRIHNCLRKSTATLNSNASETLCMHTSFE